MIIEESFYNKKVVNFGCKLYGNILQRLKQRYNFLKRKISDFAKNNPNSYIIVDALNPYSMMVSKLAKKNNIKVVTFVTYMIEFIFEKPTTIRRKLHLKFVYWLFYGQFKFVDYLVFLTENMARKIPCANKKYLVIDGMCDKDILGIELNKYETGPIVFTYRGLVSKKFGLENLVNGFVLANVPNAELHLYGPGDYVTSINNSATVKYCGVVPNEEIPGIQRNSTFLVNPRPIGDEYTQYSFPSKNIEYLTTGTVVVTTKLPCIGNEYNDIFYFFDDDSVEGISETIKRVSRLGLDQLQQHGIKAFDFVKQFKSNEIQCKKILEMIGENYENSVGM
jgi:hypothetical protein